MYHAETQIKDEGSIKTEPEKVRVVLRTCGYHEWALKKGEQLGNRQKRREQEMEGQIGKDRKEELKKVFVVLLYMKRVTERLQRDYKQHNIQLFCNAGYTIRSVGDDWTQCISKPVIEGE